MVSAYYTYFKKSKIFGEIQGIRFLYKTRNTLPKNFHEEYETYVGYGYQILVSMVSHYADFPIKNYSIEIKEGNELNFKKALDYYIPSQNDKTFQHPSISKINVLKKDTAVMCILQFMIVGTPKNNISDFNLEEIKLTMWNFKKERKEIFFRIEDVSKENINPNFVNEPNII